MVMDRQPVRGNSDSEDNSGSSQKTISVRLARMGAPVIKATFPAGTTVRTALEKNNISSSDMMLRSNGRDIKLDDVLQDNATVLIQTNVEGGPV